MENPEEGNMRHDAANATDFAVIAVHAGYP